MTHEVVTIAKVIPHPLRRDLEVVSVKPDGRPMTRVVVPWGKYPLGSQAAFYAPGKLTTFLCCTHSPEHHAEMSTPPSCFEVKTRNIHGVHSGGVLELLP